MHKFIMQIHTIPFSHISPFLIMCMHLGTIPGLCYRSQTMTSYFLIITVSGQTFIANIMQ